MDEKNDKSDSQQNPEENKNQEEERNESQQQPAENNNNQENSAPEQQQPEPEKKKIVINEEECLSQLKKLKDDFVKEYQIDKKKSLKVLARAELIITEVKENFEGDKKSNFYISFLEYHKNFWSNQALNHSQLKNYEKAIDYDLYIIEKLDNYYDKSYARILQCRINSDNLDEAFNSYAKFRSTFKKEILDKYAEIINKFEDLCNKDPKYKKKLDKLKGINKPSAGGSMKWYIIALLVLVLGFVAFRLFTANNATQIINNTIGDPRFEKDQNFDQSRPTVTDEDSTINQEENSNSNSDQNNDNEGNTQENNSENQQEIINEKLEEPAVKEERPESGNEGSEI